MIVNVFKCVRCNLVATPCQKDSRTRHRVNFFLWEVSTPRVFFCVVKSSQACVLLSGTVSVRAQTLAQSLPKIDHHSDHVVQTYLLILYPFPNCELFGICLPCKVMPTPYSWPRPSPKRSQGLGVPSKSKPPILGPTPQIVWKSKGIPNEVAARVNSSGLVQTLLHNSGTKSQTDLFFNVRKKGRQSPERKHIFLVAFNYRTSSSVLLVKCQTNTGVILKVEALGGLLCFRPRVPRENPSDPLFRRAHKSEKSGLPEENQWQGFHSGKPHECLHP